MMASLSLQQALELAISHHDAGRLPEAESLYRQILQIQPGNAEALRMLGLLAHQVGRHGDAEALIRQAAAIQPRPDYFSNLGVVLAVQKKFDDAITAFGQALALQPNDPQMLTNLASALVETRQFERAILIYREVIARQPNLVEAHYNLGKALQESGDLALACDAYRRAVALQPGHADAWNNLGTALKHLNRADEAIAAYQQALLARPGSAETYNNLGNVLLETNRADEAIECYRRAIELRPEHADALNNLGNAMKETGRIDAAFDSYRKAAALSDDSRFAGNLLYGMHFHPATTPRELYNAHAAWNARFAAAIPRMAHANNRDVNRRLRIGYVSPDLREHPVGRFMLPLMRRHDHSAFEIYCYTDSATADPVATELKSCADHWQFTAGLSDSELAARIHADEIDMLVDLTMHMKGSRLMTFARRPAPVQITYLAYCSTTGLAAMDYRFTDSRLDPEDSAGPYVEESIRLRSYWCYPAPANSPEVGPLPMASAGHVTFGCLNNFSKTNAALLATWAKILAAVPNSRIVVHAHDGSHRQEALDAFSQHGIEAGRITFSGFQPLDRYLAQYQKIDIALDPFPYAGGTTSCDALWMGVPVVSWAGATAVSRSGASLLAQLNLDDLVGDSEAAYLRIASELANDPLRLAELHASLRPRMLISPLMDDVGFARDVEAQYRKVWEQWVAATTGSAAKQR